MTDERQEYPVGALFANRKPLQGLFEGYEKSITTEQAEYYFKLKYRKNPSTVVDAGSIWLAGPINGKQVA